MPWADRLGCRLDLLDDFEHVHAWVGRVFHRRPCLAHAIDDDRAFDDAGAKHANVV